LLPLLIDAGHEVAGMTRSPGKVSELEALGAEGVACDVHDGEALRAAFGAFRPDAVVNQLTDQPDDVAQIAAAAQRNDRIRTEDTRNLLAAAGAPRSRRRWSCSTSSRTSTRRPATSSPTSPSRGRATTA
jgi:nucleoside-diphosphate-sugar epimerase